MRLFLMLTENGEWVDKPGHNRSVNFILLPLKAPEKQVEFPYSYIQKMKLIRMAIADCL